VRDRFKIIANPFSGGGRSWRLAQQAAALLRERGRNADLHRTEKAGDARLGAADSAGYQVVVAVGGDGTVNEVVNGLPVPGGPALATLPGGTANVLAKELGLPRDPRALVRVLVDGDEIPWDLAVERSSRRRFLLFASAGYDAHVVHLFHAARRGPPPFVVPSLYNMGLYALWGARSLAGYRPPRIRVEIDGRLASDDASWVQVSNIATYGGPLSFTPGARPDDAAFEVMIQEAHGRRDVVRMLVAGMINFARGKASPAPDVRFLRARSVRLVSADGREVPLQVDGDPGGHLPADFDLLPRGIRLIRPPAQSP
jgi:YegS/Rv2252/BmrU family lipid kinase